MRGKLMQEKKVIASLSCLRSYIQRFFPLISTKACYKSRYGDLCLCSVDGWSTPAALGSLD